MKICKECKKEKPFDSFWRKSTSADGYQYKCITCQTEARKRPEARKKLNKMKRKHLLKKRYGITEEFYDKKGTCCICKCTVDHIRNDNRDYLCVDHCHDTSVVRGLLCGTCNRAIGQLGDNSELLHKAYLYLKEFEDGK